MIPWNGRPFAHLASQNFPHDVCQDDFATSRTLSGLAADPLIGGRSSQESRSIFNTIGLEIAQGMPLQGF